MKMNTGRYDNLHIHCSMRHLSAAPPSSHVFETFSNTWNTSLCREVPIRGTLSNHQDLFMAVPRGKPGALWIDRTTSSVVQLYLMSSPPMPTHLLLSQVEIPVSMASQICMLRGILVPTTHTSSRPTKPNMFVITDIVAPSPLKWRETLHLMCVFMEWLHKSSSSVHLNRAYHLQIAIAPLGIPPYPTVSPSLFRGIRYLLLERPASSCLYSPLLEHSPGPNAKAVATRAPVPNDSLSKVLMCMKVCSTECANQSLPPPPSPPPLIIPPSSSVPKERERERERERYATFQVSADIRNDIYHLHHPKTGAYIGLAAIPTYATSVAMNRLFRHIRENDRLDSLEESDDETEPIDRDYRIQPLQKIALKCVFSPQFHKWIPLN